MLNLNIRIILISTERHSVVQMFGLHLFSCHVLKLIHSWLSTAGS